MVYMMILYWKGKRVKKDIIRVVDIIEVSENFILIKLEYEL